MKKIMKKPLEHYINCRREFFGKVSWNKFYTFISLPELKVSKTLAFIVSIIL